MNPTRPVGGVGVEARLCWTLALGQWPVGRVLLWLWSLLARDARSLDEATITQSPAQQAFTHTCSETVVLVSHRRQSGVW